MFSWFNCVRLFVTLWTVIHRAPLSMGFSRQEYWSGLPCPPPGDLPNPRIKLALPALQVDSLWLNHKGSLKDYIHRYLPICIFNSSTDSDMLCHLSSKKKTKLNRNAPLSSLLILILSQQNTTLLQTKCLYMISLFHHFKINTFDLFQSGFYLTVPPTKKFT